MILIKRKINITILLFSVNFCFLIYMVCLFALLLVFTSFMRGKEHSNVGNMYLFLTYTHIIHLTVTATHQTFTFQERRQAPWHHVLSINFKTTLEVLVSRIIYIFFKECWNFMYCTMGYIATHRFLGEKTRLNKPY